MPAHRFSSAFTRGVGVGLVATIVAMIAMFIDHGGANTVAAQAEKVYAPHGVDPNPGLIWSILYTVFSLTAVAFAITLIGAVRERGWARWSGFGVAIVSGFSLAYLTVASEYDSPLLPLSWRIVSGVLSALCLVIMVTAWLPSSNNRAMR